LILTAFVAGFMPFCDIESWGGVVVFDTQVFHDFSKKTWESVNNFDCLTLTFDLRP